MANLLDERVGLYEPALSYTGIDFFGPLVVKHSKRTKEHKLGSKVMVQFLFA